MINSKPRFYINPITGRLIKSNRSTFQSLKKRRFRIDGDACFYNTGTAKKCFEKLLKLYPDLVYPSSNFINIPKTFKHGRARAFVKHKNKIIGFIDKKGKKHRLNKPIHSKKELPIIYDSFDVLPNILKKHKPISPEEQYVIEKQIAKSEPLSNININILFNPLHNDFIPTKLNISDEEKNYIINTINQHLLPNKLPPISRNLNISGILKYNNYIIGFIDLDNKIQRFSQPIKIIELPYQSDAIKQIQTIPSKLTESVETIPTELTESKTPSELTESIETIPTELTESIETIPTELTESEPIIFDDRKSISDLLSDDEIETTTPTETITEPTPTEEIETITPAETITEPTPTEEIETITPTETITEPTPTEEMETITQTETITEPTPTEEMETITPPETITEPTPTEEIETITPQETITEPTPTEEMETITPPETITEPTPTEEIETITPPETITEPSEVETISEPSEVETISQPEPSKEIETVTETISEPEPSKEVETVTETISEPEPSEEVETVTETISEPEPSEEVEAVTETISEPEPSEEIEAITETISEPEPSEEIEAITETISEPEPSKEVETITETISEPEPSKEVETVTETISEPEPSKEVETITETISEPEPSKEVETISERPTEKVETITETISKTPTEKVDKKILESIAIQTEDTDTTINKQPSSQETKVSTITPKLSRFVSDASDEFKNKLKLLTISKKITDTLPSIETIKKEDKIKLDEYIQTTPILSEKETQTIVEKIKCLDGEQFDQNEKRCLPCTYYELIWDPEFKMCKPILKEKVVEKKDINKMLLDIDLKGLELITDDKQNIIGYIQK